MNKWNTLVIIIDPVLVNLGFTNDKESTYKLDPLYLTIINFESQALLCPYNAKLSFRILEFFLLFLEKNCWLTTKLLTNYYPIWSYFRNLSVFEIWKKSLEQFLIHSHHWLTDRYSGGVQDDKKVLNYCDAFSYPSIVVILNKNIRNEHYDENR